MEERRPIDANGWIWVICDFKRWFCSICEATARCSEALFAIIPAKLLSCRQNSGIRKLLAFCLYAVSY